MSEPAAPSPDARRQGPLWPPWLDAIVIAGVFVGLAAWTWGAWPDVLMDFGRELYVAWRVSQGAVLYRDVASFYGPLSPYVNGAAFRLFGVGLLTLALVNMAVLAAVTAALWAIVRKGSSGGRLAASVGALVFLACCGFAQLVSAGSFNFVCPYSHEATHGFALATAALFASLRLLDTARPRWAAMAGACVGLAFLTKPESFVAAAGASGAVLLLALLGPRPRPDPRRATSLFAVAALVPPAVAFALLALAMPVWDAWIGVLGSWAFVGNDELWRSPYFTWSTGTSDLAGNLLALGRTAVVQLAVLAPAAGLAWLARGRDRLARPLAAAAALIVLLALAPSWRSPAWRELGRPFPLAALAALAASARALWLSRHDREAFLRHGARVALAVFALLLLPRMALNARLYHYGFVLAGPSLLLVVAALVDWIPQALDRRGGSGVVFRAASLAVFAVMMASQLATTQSWQQQKGIVVGEGKDRFRSDARGAFVSATLRGLAGAIRPGETLVVLPEGAMINYLLRAPSSIPYLSWLPSDVFGEDELLGSLRSRPPSLIVLVHRDTSEFGARFFGRDYGQLVTRWIAERYQPIGHAGDPPLQPGSAFGLAAFRLRAEIPAPLPNAR